MFSEVREYQPGDDTRIIDWNVTARFNHPYVKVFEEERELTVILLVDVSASEQFGTKTQFKNDLVTEICAVLSFSAIQNNDKIGVIFFSDRIEKFIPPKKGKMHILRIIRELIEFKPVNKGTDITGALKYLTSVVKKRSIAFLLSDFIAPDFSDAMKITNKKHDLVAIKIFDQREALLPDVGLLNVADAETGREMIIDTSDHALREAYIHHYKNHENKINNVFARSGVDSVKIRTDQSYVQPLMHLFKRRGQRA